MQINKNDIAACSSPALLSINKVQPHPLQRTALARNSQPKKPVIGKNILGMLFVFYLLHVRPRELQKVNGSSFTECKLWFSFCFNIPTSSISHDRDLNCYSFLFESHMHSTSGGFFIG